MKFSKLKKVRDEIGASTAEYAVCTGASVGFAGVLVKLLSSDLGSKVINSIFDGVMGFLPF